MELCRLRLFGQNIIKGNHWGLGGVQVLPLQGCCNALVTSNYLRNFDQWYNFTSMLANTSNLRNY